MIEVEGLTKYYGGFAALEDVSFNVARGEILAFLGPNGAGKSTTMKILTGYISPTRGDARIDGMSVVEHSLKIRRRVGYLPETTPLYYDMQVNEFLDFAARLRRIPRALRRERLEWAMGICHLQTFWRKPIAVLSRGQKQRVGFAQAILHDPDVLILDEPTAGLDPNQILDVRALIREFEREGKTILLSTHIFQEVEAMCERVVIVHQGRIAADTTKADLRERHGNLEKAFRALTSDAHTPAVAAAAPGREGSDG